MDIKNLVGVSPQSEECFSPKATPAMLSRRLIGLFVISSILAFAIFGILKLNSKGIITPETGSSFLALWAIAALLTFRVFVFAYHDLAKQLSGCGNCARCKLPMKIISGTLTWSALSPANCYQCRNCGAIICATCIRYTDTLDGCKCRVPGWQVRCSSMTSQIVSAHAATASYDCNANGAMPPSRWHSAQRRSMIREI